MFLFNRTYCFYFEAPSTQIEPKTKTHLKINFGKVQIINIFFGNVHQGPYLIELSHCCCFSKKLSLLPHRDEKLWA